MASPDTTKDTIYIDIDDEITGIIDKVSQSKHKIVALVLPKRASVLQSSVNMKLLKRSGDSQKKKLVLITSEAGLLPLAGAVKLHVAKTLQSKPVIPAAPKVPSDDVNLDDSSDALEQDQDDLDDSEDVDQSELNDKNLDTKKPVGELDAESKPKKVQQFEETIDIDEEPDPEVQSEAGKKDKKPKKDKKLNIPNFNAFRKKLLIGGGIFVLLIIGWYVSSFVLPSAKITIITDSLSVNTDVAVTLSGSAKEVDLEKSIIPAVSKSIKKTDTEKVQATGKKNVGEKAKGTVSIKLTDCSKSSVTVPEGTRVSSGSLNFNLQKSVTLISVPIAGICRNDIPIALPYTTATIDVVAQDSGDQFNISGGRTFSVNGFGNVTGFDSSAMSGGTNKEVTVVSQEDIDGATTKLIDKSKAAALTDLKAQLKDSNLFAIAETITNDKPVVTPSPAVGTEASDVTVTSVINYSLLGAKREDLKTVIVNSAKSEINNKQQTISNDGLDQAVIKSSDQVSPTQQKISIQSTISTGAQEEQDSLKKEVAGKKKGEVQQIISARAGVKEVQVSYSPFWVYSTPNKLNKITIIYQKAK